MATNEARAGIRAVGKLRGIVDLRPFKGREGTEVKGVRVYLDVDELEPLVLDVYKPESVEVLRPATGSVVELTLRVDRKTSKVKVVSAAVL